MKIYWRNEIVPIVLIAASFILAAAVWPHAPDRIPVHWGLSGQPNGYAGKVGLFYPALIALGVYALMLFLPRVDPRGRNYDRFRGAYTFIRMAIVAALVCIGIFTSLWALDVKVDINVAVPVVVGLLLMVLGNFMGKIRSNWFAGIRTPWTLSSAESWNKTHRLGGRMFVLFGLVLAVAAPFQKSWTPVLVAVMVGIIVVTLFVYSYLVWKRDPDARKLSARWTDRDGGKE